MNKVDWRRVYKAVLAAEVVLIIVVTFMGLICLQSQLRYISDVFVVLVLVIMDTSYIFSQVCIVYLLLYFRVWSHFIIINKWYVIVN